MLKLSSGLELINMLFIFMYQYIRVYVLNEGLYERQFHLLSFEVNQNMRL